MAEKTEDKGCAQIVFWGIAAAIFIFYILPALDVGLSKLADLTSSTGFIVLAIIGMIAYFAYSD